MTNRDVYNRALTLVNEAISGGDTSDYEERAPYLLAEIVTECYRLDEAYRAAHGLQPGTEITAASLPLSDTFALSGVFVPAVAYDLAALLCLDENEKMSDVFFEKFADAVSEVVMNIPAISKKTKDCYNLL